MRKLLAIAFSIPLAACTVGSDPVMPGDDGTEHPDPMPMPDPSGQGISGTIMQDTTWSGVNRFKQVTTIPTGVTVTVAAGSTMNMADGASFVVQGTLKIEGTAAAKVIAAPEAGAAYWGGFSVTGTLDIKYGDFTSGSISTSSATANLIITDTKMFKAGGDYIVMNGGTINMTYSKVGAAVGETDSTHCNFHINAASSITVTNSEINGAPYGVMFYGGVNANFKMNNWYGAGNPPTGADVDTKSGVSGDFSMGWFEKGAPVAGAGATLTAGNLSPTKLTNVGPRP